jgi:N-acetylglutamate synthase-like GNAT family acetyltransferase
MTAWQSNTRITVRRAEASDAEAIQGLYLELVANPAVSVLPERIAELALDSNTLLFVAETEGAVVGTVLAALCQDVMFRRQPFAVIENVVVSSTCRRLGVGAALLKEVERHCLAAQCSKIMLLSSVKRTEAHIFFKRAGFVGSLKMGFIKYRRQFEAAG